MAVSLTSLNSAHPAPSHDRSTPGERVRGASAKTTARAGSGDWGPATVIDSLPGNAAPPAAKGHWTDRFTHGLNKLGVSSFYRLAWLSGPTALESVFAVIDETVGKVASGEIAASTTIRALESILRGQNAIVLRLQDIREQVRANAERLANGEKTSPDSWAATNRLGNDLLNHHLSDGARFAAAFNEKLGYSASGESVFADSSGLVNHLAHTDFLGGTDKSGRHLISKHARKVELPTTEGDLANSLFSVDAFAGGQFNLAAFGIPAQATTDAEGNAVYDLAPDTTEKFLAQIDTAIEKVKSTIVGHGKNLATAYEVEEYYRNAIDSFIRGQEDATFPHLLGDAESKRTARRQAAAAFPDLVGDGAGKNAVPGQDVVRGQDDATAPDRVGDGASKNLAPGQEFLRGPDAITILDLIDDGATNGNDANLVSDSGPFADDDSPASDNKRENILELLYQYRQRLHRAHIKGWLERIAQLDGRQGQYEPLGRYKQHDLIKQAIVQLLTPAQIADLYGDDAARAARDAAATPGGSGPAKEARINAAHALFVDGPENRALSPDERALRAITILTPQAEAPARA